MLTISHRSFARARRGLTLIELVVVLAILAAVAAILVPLLPNLLRRAHKATDATQSGETSKFLQLYQALYYGYPTGFDSLTDGTTTFPDYLPWDGAPAGTPFGGFVTAGQLTAAEVAALSKVGIKSVAKLAPAGAVALAGTPGYEMFHPTMWPYLGSTPTDPAGALAPINTTDNYAILNRTAIINAGSPFLANVLASDATARFVVFGVGPKCTMVGKTIQDAPTSVPQNDSFTPDTTYSRVGVVFQVSGVGVNNLDGRAVFVCACALEDDELEATEKDIIGYYKVIRQTP